MMELATSLSFSESANFIDRERNSAKISALEFGGLQHLEVL